MGINCGLLFHIQFFNRYAQKKNDCKIFFMADANKNTIENTTHNVNYFIHFTHTMQKLC